MKKIRRPYFVDGRRVWITGDSEQDVCDQFAVMLMDAKGISPKKRESHPLCELVDAWFDYKKQHNQIGIQTIKAYTIHVREIKEHFNGVMVGQIGWKEVQAFLDKYSKKSRSTAHQKRIVLGQAMQWAVDDGLIDVNPTRDSRIIIEQKANRRCEVPLQKYLEMIGKIQEIAYARDRLLFGLLALTGMRRGEALALQWQDISWVDGIINIRRAVVFDGNRPVIKGPKSDAGIRAYPLVAQLREVLLPLKKSIGYIVSIDGFSPLSETAFTRAWERVCKQINQEKFTAHQFRHTVAGILASSPSISPKTTQTMMGHSDFSTTMDIYAKTEIATSLAAGRIFTEIIKSS